MKLKSHQHFETESTIIKKKKREAENSILGVYPKKWKAGSQTDVCTPMFTEASFTRAKMGKQPIVHGSRKR